MPSKDDKDEIFRKITDEVTKAIRTIPDDNQVNAVLAQLKKLMELDVKPLDFIRGAENTLDFKMMAGMLYAVTSDLKTTVIHNSALKSYLENIKENGELDADGSFSGVPVGREIDEFSRAFNLFLQALINLEGKLFQVKNK